MTPEQAKNTMAFLERVDLKGVEVPAFVDVMQALDKLRLGTPGVSNTQNGLSAGDTSLPNGRCVPRMTPFCD